MRAKLELLVSRTEALKKPPGTDILIAGGSYEFIEEHLLAGGMPSAGVKGKSEPVKMYGMVNMSKAEDIPGAGADGPRSMALTEGGVENHALAGDMSLISGSAVVKLKKGLTLRDGQSKEAGPVLQLDKGKAAYSFSGGGKI